MNYRNCGDLMSPPSRRQPLRRPFSASPARNISDMAAVTAAPLWITISATTTPLLFVAPTLDNQNSVVNYRWRWWSSVLCLVAGPQGNGGSGNSSFGCSFLSPSTQQQQGMESEGTLVSSGWWRYVGRYPGFLSFPSLQMILGHTCGRFATVIQTKNPKSTQQSKRGRTITEFHWNKRENRHNEVLGPP